MRHLILATLVVLPACADDAQPPDEQEVITTVILELTPTGGQAMVFEFDDPDGDGGAAPTIDPIEIGIGSYSARVRFENRLETPPEDITAEVDDEAEQHQVFFTGSALAAGDLAYTYADMDANGLPIGLTGSMSAPSDGTGDLTVTLRHLPPINGQPTKTAGLETQVRNGGFDGIPGESDAQVTFPVTVLPGDAKAVVQDFH